MICVCSQSTSPQSTFHDKRLNGNCSVENHGRCHVDQMIRVNTAGDGLADSRCLLVGQMHGEDLIAGLQCSCQCPLPRAYLEGAPDKPSWGTKSLQTKENDH